MGLSSDTQALLKRRWVAAWVAVWVKRRWVAVWVKRRWVNAWVAASLGRNSGLKGVRKVEEAEGPPTLSVTLLAACVCRI